MGKTDLSKKISVGISTCLLGEKVRFDGGHKKNDFILNTLSQFFDWVPVCPEVEIGLGTPRESLRLIGQTDSPNFVTSKSKKDFTKSINEFSQKKVKELAGMNLDGYILKKDSPSCGMERVKVYPASGMPVRKGTGIFARHLIEGIPFLPVEEEGRLMDMKLRENFIVRVFCHHRWRKLTEKSFQLKNLVEFHTRHKLLVMAHSEQHMRMLGKLVAQAKHQEPEAVLWQYSKLFFEGLRFKSTARKHTNVLQHIMGFFKRNIDPTDKKELLQIIEDYRLGLLPLIVPLTLIKHYVNKFDIQYAKDQIYLNPHPKELLLLNHV